MRHRAAQLALGASALPFLLELPYVFQAMRNSPAERWNWCFLLMATGCGALGWLGGGSRAVSRTARRPWQFVLLAPPMALLLFAIFRHIHLGILLAGIALPMALGCALLGWHRTAAFAPAAALLALACPSVGMILSMLCGMDGTRVKALLAFALCLVALLWRLRPASIPRPSTLLFIGATGMLVCGALLKNHFVALAPPIRPDFGLLADDGFLGVREIELEQDRRFYGNSLVERYLFQGNDDGNMTISVLVVSKMENVHQVHPVTYCLRVNGYRILQERSYRLPAEIGSGTEVLELLAERNGRETLFWQWYSSPGRSTSSFLLFRSLYSRAEPWNVYLLNTEVDLDAETSRANLAHLIKAFSHRQTGEARPDR